MARKPDGSETAYVAVGTRVKSRDNRLGVVEGRAPAKPNPKEPLDSAKSAGPRTSRGLVRVRFPRDGATEDVPVAVARGWADRHRAALTEQWASHLRAAIAHDEAPGAA